jgi:phosphoribosylaminoimidazole-succinocarboxamide synthase
MAPDTQTVNRGYFLQRDGMMKLARQGKVKDVYEVDQHTLEFVFSDKISVFDKTIPSLIPHKGETLCRSSAFWFQVARSCGIKTHFRELIPPNRMRVQKVQVLPYSKINRKSSNYLIPLEVISRHYVAGSLWDRMKDGKVKPAKLGFKAAKEIKYGDKLPEPLIEFTTKLEKVDRLLTKTEAMKIAALTNDEFKSVMDAVLKIDERIEEEVEKRDLIHVDGKKEYAFDEERELMIVDTFGTADEDRWWDWEAYSKGQFTELSKENVRQYYRQLGYYDKLAEARKMGKGEPRIPSLPESKINEISDLYIEMFERITGESYR